MPLIDQVGQGLLEPEKIDRSFVRAITSEHRTAAIVSSTIELAYQLVLTVVAEGVETALDRQRLASMNCDVIQGFLVSPAVPASAPATADLGFRPHISLTSPDRAVR